MASVKMRQCCGCMEKKNGKEMLRIVRTPEGDVRYDPTGRSSGRGTYVCRSGECIERAFKRKGIARTLHTDIDPQTAEELMKALTEEAADAKA